MTDPTISVLVPLFDAGSTVAGSLGSVLSQDLEDLEVVVVDDGSSDDGPEIVEGLAATDPRIRLIQQPNGGVSAARNAAQNAAHGRYIYFLDPDDTAEPGALSALVARAESSGLGAAVGHHRVVGPSGETLTDHFIAPPEVGLDELVSGCSTRCGSHVVRRDLASDVRFDRGLSTWEDRDYWMRLAETGVRWARVDQVATEYVVGAGGLSADAVDMASNAEKVLSGLFERQAPLGESRLLRDCSQERLDGLLADHALLCAHRVVARGGPAAAKAAAGIVKATKTEVDSIPPERLADRALFGVVFACGFRPTETAFGEGLWMEGIALLWRMLGLSARQTADAWRAFRLQMIAPDAIADELVDRCATATGIIVVGYGANGRVLAARAAARGVQVRVRDDRFENGGPLPNGLGVPVEPMNAPAASGWRVVVTPLADGGLMGRFAKETPLRWVEARQTLVALHRGAIPA